MLFTIQTYLEELVARRNLADVDGYVVQIANLYFHSRSMTSGDEFLRRMRRIKTAFFVSNGIRKRSEFERELLQRLDKRFKKKLASSVDRSFPGGTDPERERLQRLPRRTIGVLLREFKHAIETRAIDPFWISRAAGKLVPKPEREAQSHFALFAKGVLGSRGNLLREIASGVGYVDVGLSFNSPVLHLIEFKVLTGKFVGADQLQHYMHNERRRQGHLVVIDALPAKKKKNLPVTITIPDGTIRVLQIDINPVAPSRMNR